MSEQFISFKGNFSNTFEGDWVIFESDDAPPYGITGSTFPSLTGSSWHIHKVISSPMLYQPTNIELTEFIKDYIDLISKEVTQKIIEEKKLIKENIRILSEIAQLQENWNNYNAKSFDPTLVFRVMSLITSEELNYQPEIFPTARESIQIEYEKDENHYLELEIFIDNIIGYRRIYDKINEYLQLTEKQAFDLINEFQSTK